MLDRFYDLLSDQYVFAYWSGEERWYDWNPLSERSAARRRRAMT